MILNEKMITLRDAAKLMPGQRGDTPSISTLWRWASKGVGGVVLETISIGKSRFTSVEALSRFARRCSERTPNFCDPNIETPVQRDRDHRNASEALAKAGW